MLELRAAVHEAVVQEQKCKNSPEFNAVKDAIARGNEPLAVVKLYPSHASLEQCHFVKKTALTTSIHFNKKINFLTQ
ncbi:MAG: hypothetical protein ACRC1U_04675 [Vibrionaceae bacterium]